MKNKVKKMFALLSAAGFSLIASAGTYTYNGATVSQYAKAEATDLMSNKWTSNASPEAGNGYEIINGKICGCGFDTFPGDSLTLSNGTLVLRNVGTGSLSLGNVILDGGTFVALNNSTAASTLINATIHGDFSVQGSGTSTFLLQRNAATANSMTFDGHFSGSANIVLKKNTYSNGGTMAYFFTGDLSQYTGTMIVGRTDYGSNNDFLTADKSPYYAADALFGDTTVAGTIRLSPYAGRVGCCGHSKYYGAFSVSNLEFSEGSAICVAFNSSASTGSTIRVTSALSLPADANVSVDICALDVPTTANNNIPAIHWPILVAPAETAMTESKFCLRLDVGNSFSRSDLAWYANTQLSLSVEPNEAGEKVLYLNANPVVRLETSATKGSSSSSKDSYSALLPDQMYMWQDGAAGDLFDPGTSYLVYNKYLASPLTEDVDFAGKILALVGGSAEWRFFNSHEIRIGHLTMADTALLFFGYASPTITGGVIDVLDYGGDVRFQGKHNETMTIDSEIRGNGGIAFSVWSDSDWKDYRATLVLKGTNTAFSGKMRLFSNSANMLPEKTDRLTKLVVHDGRSLGGACATTNYNALALTTNTMLSVQATTAITEPTRGVFVEGHGGAIEVPTATDTFTIGSSTTFAGTLYKKGAGTLALGGTAAFTSDLLDTPIAGTNVLRVTEGWLRPTTKGCADGLAIVFSEGTGLRFAPRSETDADVNAYGLVDVKWATPFDLTATGGKLSVAVDFPSASPREDFQFAVCTVSAAAAEALDLDSNIALQKVRGYGASVVRRANPDGSVTYLANYVVRGMLIIVE